MKAKKDLKTEKITIRCTEEQKRKIEDAAHALDMKAGPYALDKAIKGTACNHYSKKKLTKSLVLISNHLDEIYELIYSTNGNLIEKEKIISALDAARKETTITWKY